MTVVSQTAAAEPVVAFALQSTSHVIAGGSSRTMASPVEVGKCLERSQNEKRGLLMCGFGKKNAYVAVFRLPHMQVRADAVR